LAFQSTARADVRALAIGLALGAAVGGVLGGAYVAGGMAQAADARAQTARTARFARAEVATVIIAAPTDNRIAPAPVPKAQPVRVVTGVKLNAPRDRDCLADAIYYEARGESPAGQAAIAQVVLNRVRHPAFPKSVCGVVFQGLASDTCQFAFACNGAMDRPKETAAWARAEKIAARALTGFVMPEVGQATHFHAADVQPDWGHGLMKVAQVGLHVFYRFGGKAGAPGRFDGTIHASAPGSDGPRAYASLTPALHTGADHPPSATYAPAPASAEPRPAVAVAVQPVSTPLVIVPPPIKPKDAGLPQLARPIQVSAAS
jgi:spore germination cell wall hydrolase CwlJ-like protein